MNEENPRTMAAILADIADLGPFLPGSVRKDHRKYVNKRGETVVYEVQPRLSYPVGRGKFKDKRFPAKAFERVRKLTENYKRFRALVAELEEAAVREYLPGSKKKDLVTLASVMPCIAPIADAIGKLTGGDADERILEACFETFRKTFERVSESLTAGLRTKRTIGIRSVWIGTVGGFAKARYPYAPGEVTGRDAVKCFGGEEQSGTVRTKDGKGVRGLPKATRAARLLVAETAVRSASFEEAAETLRERGLDIGRSMVRLIALEAARRTQAAVRKDRPKRRRPWRRWKPPYWAKRVTRTLVVMVDGKAFPCAKADLAGRKGRNGGSAKSRNANVICCGWFEWVDRKGRPIFAPHSIRYEVTGEGGAALGRTVWRVAVQEGVLDAKRVQFVSDGEEELEHVYQEHFKALPNCVRVLDAMHACGYVDTVAKALEPDGGKAARISRRLRRRLVKAGWKGCLSSLERIFGKDASSRLCGDARKAWNYLEKRSGMMDYGSYARRRLVIGSGMVEVGCKLTIGGRLAGPGMHWRFRNGVGIAELRAVMRSGLIIAV